MNEKDELLVRIHKEIFGHIDRDLNYKKRNPPMADWYNEGWGTNEYT